MSTYAARTEVPAERSRNEIEQTLARYGASAFGYLTQADRAVLVFEANGRRISGPLASIMAQRRLGGIDTSPWCDMRFHSGEIVIATISNGHCTPGASPAQGRKIGSR